MNKNAKKTRTLSVVMAIALATAILLTTGIMAYANPNTNTPTIIDTNASVDVFSTDMADTDATPVVEDGFDALAVDKAPALPEGSNTPDTPEIATTPKIDKTNEAFVVPEDAEEPETPDAFEAASRITGDINGDDRVDGNDLTLLSQHLADWDVDINTDAADYNEDGEINSLDAVQLAQSIEKGGNFSPITPPSDTVTYSWADVTRDGVVNKDDLNAVTCHLLNLTGRTEYPALSDPTVADFDRDGRVTPKDGQIIYDYLVSIGIIVDGSDSLSPITPPGNTITYSWADVTRDGVVSKDDFDAVTCHLLNLTGRTKFPALPDPTVADFDRDGKVTPKDGQIIYDYLVSIGIIVE